MYTIGKNIYEFNINRMFQAIHSNFLGQFNTKSC